MPPKKKKGKKGGKKKGKNGELTEEDQLKLKSHEVLALKDNLAFRKDIARRTKAAFEELKDRLDETNTQIEEIENTHKSSNAYLTHQYKTMQNDMAVKMHQLETELNLTRKTLEKTQQDLEHERSEKKRIQKEKDDLIFELENWIKKLEINCDSTIDKTFNDFNLKLNTSKQEWNKKAAELQAKNKMLLAELGIAIHDI